MFLKDKATNNYLPLPSSSGADGREVQLRKTDSYIQWRYEDLDWQNLVPLSDIKGNKGDKGEDGQEISLRTEASVIQWRLGDGGWQDLFTMETYATITIGVVTTGEAGTEATVSNSGTKEEAVLDFTIPKGFTPKFRVKDDYWYVSYDNGLTWESVGSRASYTAEEKAREEAETQRESNEAARESAETSRQSAESSRVSAESSRVTAEEGRATAEAARKRLWGNASANATTTESGSTATVSVTLGDDKVVFNFGIPKGDKGDTGDVSHHASQHAIGGSDPVTPSSIGAASTSHNSTHKTGGSDALTPSDIGAASSVHASQHSASGSDPITPALIGAAVPSASVSATLETWTDNTCTVAVSGVTASNNIVVSLGTTTADEFAAAVAAQLHCTAQGADSITVTAFGTVPSISLPINVLIVG